MLLKHTSKGFLSKLRMEHGDDSAENKVKNLTNQCLLNMVEAKKKEMEY